LGIELAAGIMQVTGHFPIAAIMMLVAVFLFGVLEGGILFFRRVV
jgi:hypothetical protein